MMNRDMCVNVRTVSVRSRDTGFSKSKKMRRALRLHLGPDQKSTLTPVIPGLIHLPTIAAPKARTSFAHHSRNNSGPSRRESEPSI